MTAHRSRPAPATRPVRTVTFTLLFTFLLLFSLFGPQIAQPANASSPITALAAKQYGGEAHLMGVGPAAVGKIQARGDQLVDGNGLRYFVAGINYEGPVDR